MSQKDARLAGHRPVNTAHTTHLISVGYIYKYIFLNEQRSKDAAAKKSPNTSGVYI